MWCVFKRSNHTAQPRKIVCMQMIEWRHEVDPKVGGLVPEGPGTREQSYRVVFLILRFTEGIWSFVAVNKWAQHISDRNA